jgi:hypothetical protein
VTTTKSLSSPRNCFGGEVARLAPTRQQVWRGRVLRPNAGHQRHKGTRSAADRGDVRRPQSAADFVRATNCYEQDPTLREVRGGDSLKAIEDRNGWCRAGDIGCADAVNPAHATSRCNSFVIRTCDAHKAAVLSRPVNLQAGAAAMALS